VNVVLLLALLGLFVAEAWTLFAKPTKPAFAVAVSGTFLFGTLAVLLFVWILRLERFEEAHYYSLPVEPPGTHTVRIRSIEGVPGLSAIPVPKGVRRGFHSVPGGKPSVPMDRVLRCGWRLRGMDARWHLCGEGCPCSPKRAVFDTRWDPRFEKGTFSGLDLEYQVSEETRPVLELIDLEVGGPLSYVAEVSMVRGLGGCLEVALILGSLVGGAGLIVQVARRRRLRR
jgi:hypothetical protein